MEGNFTSVVDVGVGYMTAHRRDKAGGGGGEGKGWVEKLARIVVRKVEPFHGFVM